ncbi:MAG TPA: GWxTD domain-containing protein [Vicinamibacteria bacterium]|nr:GWxTD domain-containing protein [Vicinamibacteria bacterium]
MSVRPKWWLAVAVLGLSVPRVLVALDKEDKKWLDEVKPIMLTDEEKSFRNLKDKADRLEFQKIFWARRNPDLEASTNEYQAEYQKAVAEADTKYKVAGRPGSTSDCGRVFILLGKPDEIKKEEGTVSPGLRPAETWIYKDRPNQTFTGGKAEIVFDTECRFPMGSRVSEQLNRVAEQRIAHPNIDYRLTKDGRLVKLADLLPKPTAAQALLKAPRQDFPVATQVGFLKVLDGGSAVLGLVRGEAAGLTVEEVGGKKTAKVVVVAQALDESGKAAAFAEQTTVAPVVDGALVASYRMGLKPGKYTLRAGALDEKTGKGSVATIPLEVPAFNKGELSLGTVLLLQDVEDLPAGSNPDPQNPYGAFTLGTARLIPHFGQTFTKSDSISIFYQFYDLKVDDATGKASGSAILSILRDGKAPVAKAPEQTIETVIGGNVVGPVPLGKYEPGKYVVQIKVTDKLAKKDVAQEVPFEIKP